MSLHPNDCSTRFYQSEKEENKRSRCAVAVSKKSSKSCGWKEVTCGLNAQERALCGTWCTPELQKAVEKGYQILKIHEVWHFTPENRRVGLFKEYVNTWLKLKQESAGWPADCVTPEQQEAYLADYEAHEGIKLENVADDPGQKVIAKMLLNR